ncbi:YraN family protein [Myxococcota bacterium]|nr:YraN family protein [Myxococcota bacterium]
MPTHQKWNRPQLSRRELGAEGEDRAAADLEARGYRIVERNVRAGGVEIDIIARRGRTLAFVEVKTRRSRRQGPPEAAVHGAKQARLIRGAAAWLREHGTRAARVRFDVVACELDEAGRWSLRHLKGAFDASTQYGY